LPMDALNGVTYYPDLFSNIRNSDDTYNTTVIVSETLTLPDITHTDTNGSPVVLPAQTAMVCSGGGASPSGIAYDRVLLTGQTTSYRTGDDAWSLANGVYDYTPPVYPVSYAALDFNAVSPFTTLISNNAFGDKNRYTDVNGLQVYGDNYVIDHLTGLGWLNIEKTGMDWNGFIDDAYGLTTLTFSDWRVPSINEFVSIMNRDITVPTNFAPFNISTGVFWISTTDLQDTTKSFYWQVDVGGGRNITRIKTDANRECYYVRNHYT